MELKKKVLSGLRWSAGANFLGQLITWGITIIIIRLLSPADYGMMELAGVFLTFLTLLNELGMGAAVIQKKDLDEKTLKALFGLLLINSVLFFALLFISAPFIAGFYNEPRLTELIRFLSVHLLLIGFTVIPQSVLLREMEFRKFATIEFGTSIAGSITTLVLALNELGVWALVWGYLMKRIISMVVFNIVKPFPHLPSFSMKGMGRVFSFGGYVTLSRILWFFSSKADSLIIGKVLGKELLGFYAIGTHLASLPMEKISPLVNRVAFPAFSSVQSEPRTAGRHFLKAVRVMSFFAFPIVWGISSIAPEIVNVFLGAKWSQAALPLQIIALVVPVRMISNLMSPAAFGLGRADVSFLIELLSVILMPVAFFIGSFWGLLGVSLAWAVAFPVVFAFNLYRMVRILEISLSQVFEAMKNPAILSLIMYLFVQIVKSIPIEVASQVPKMIFLIVCGATIYGSMTLIFNRGGIIEIKELAKG